MLNLAKISYQQICDCKNKWVFLLWDLLNYCLFNPDVRTLDPQLHVTWHSLTLLVLCLFRSDGDRSWLLYQRQGVLPRVPKALLRRVHREDVLLLIHAVQRRAARQGRARQHKMLVVRAAGSLRHPCAHVGRDIQQQCSCIQR